MGETFLTKLSSKEESKHDHYTKFLIDTNMAVSASEKSFFDN